MLISLINKKYSINAEKFRLFYIVKTVIPQHNTKYFRKTSTLK